MYTEKEINETIGSYFVNKFYDFETENVFRREALFTESFKRLAPVAELLAIKTESIPKYEMVFVASKDSRQIQYSSFIDYGSSIDLKGRSIEVCGIFNSPTFALAAACARIIKRQSNEVNNG